MKYDKKLEEFIQKYKFQWVNVIDRKGKEHTGLLAHWNETGTTLGDGIKMSDPIIELHGTGASVSEIIAVNEIYSIYIRKVDENNNIITSDRILDEEQRSIAGRCWSLKEADKLLSLLNKTSTENWEIVSGVDKSYKPTRECFDIQVKSPINYNKASMDLTECLVSVHNNSETT